MKTSADYTLSGLRQRGMPDHIARAFVINFQDESGLDAGIEEHEANVHGTKDFGLAQWTGPRRDALVQFAAANGKPASDADLQMDFLMQELQGPESGAWAKIQAARTSGEAGAAIVNIRQDGFADDDALDHARAPGLMRMARWSLVCWA